MDNNISKKKNVINAILIFLATIGIVFGIFSVFNAGLASASINGTDTNLVCCGENIDPDGNENDTIPIDTNKRPITLASKVKTDISITTTSEKPMADVIFVMDTSGSMYDEIDTLILKMGDVATDLRDKHKINLSYKLIGITDNYGGRLDDYVTNMFPTHISNHLEDWGPATQDIANYYSWRSGAVRVIVPLSDEGAENGNPCRDPGDDRDAITNAISAAKNNNVIVFPIMCSGQTQCGINLGNDLAKETGGQMFLSTDPSSDIAKIIAEIVLKSAINQPDLTLTSSDISFASVLNSIIVTATIHNDGTKDASNVAIRFIDYDQVKGTTSQIGTDQTISSISAKGTGTASVSWYPKSKGLHTIRVVVDPENAIDEWKEDNNYAEKVYDTAVESIYINAQTPNDQIVANYIKEQLIASGKNIVDTEVSASIGIVVGSPLVNSKAAELNKITMPKWGWDDVNTRIKVYNTFGDMLYSSVVGTIDASVSPDGKRYVLVYGIGISGTVAAARTFLDAPDSYISGSGLEYCENKYISDTYKLDTETSIRNALSYNLDDTDNDGLKNSDESSHGTKRYVWDTDFDRMSDGWEVQYNLNPKDSSDASQDPDKDGLTNLQEYENNTDPMGQDIWAVIVGAADTRQDVVDMHNLLNNFCGYQNNNIRWNQFPSLQDVKNYLDWVEKNSDADDKVVFASSTHGGLRQDRNRDENGGRDAVIAYSWNHGDPAPRDTQLMYDDELFASLNDINSLEKIVILSACHSGGFINDLDNINNILVITSSKEDEISTSSLLTHKTDFIKNFINKINHGSKTVENAFDDTLLPLCDCMIGCGGITNIIVMFHPQKFDDIQGDTYFQASPYGKTTLSNKMFLNAMFPQSTQSHFTGDYTERTEDYDSDGLIDSLVIDTGINIDTTGNYTIFAELLDNNTNAIAFAYNMTYMNIGIQNRSIVFSGESIYSSRTNGTFQVVNLILLDEKEQIIDYQSNPYTTNNYQYTSFQRPSVYFTNNFTDRANDTDGDGIYDELEITVEMNASIHGNYSINGDLVDTNGTHIYYANTSMELNEGINFVIMKFDGTYIFRSKINGNYMLKNLSVVMGFDEPVIDKLNIAYTTLSYNYTDFQKTDVYFTNMITDTGTDADANGLFDYLTVNIAVNVTLTGNYTVKGDLHDNSGNHISSSSTAHLDVGSQILPLNFDGHSIYQNKMSGQYTVTNISVYNEDCSIFFDGATTPHTTQSYNYLSFEIPPTNISGTYIDFGKDTNGDSLYDYLAIEVEVVIDQSGNYTLYGFIEVNDTIISAFNTTYLPVGIHNVTLQFDGTQILQSGTYPLNYLRLTRLHNLTPSEVVDEISDAYITQYYNVSDFNRAAINFTGTYSDNGIDTNSNTLYDYLRISTALNVGMAGNYSIYAYLYQNDTYITNSEQNIYLPAGLQNITLDFSGGLIRDKQINGPYTLALVEVYDANKTYVSGDRPSYTTSYYDYTSFDRLGYFLGFYKEYGIDLNNNSLYDLLRINSSVNVHHEGNYLVELGLNASDGSFIVKCSNYTHLSAGTHYVSVDVPGIRIYESGFNGPYVVDYLKLYENNTLLDYVSNPLNTSAYLFSQFEHVIYNETDLVIDSSDIIVSNNRFVGAALKISATVHNIGFLSASGVVVQFFNGNPSTGYLIGSQTIVSIPSGGIGVAQMIPSNKYDLTWILTNGTRNIYVQVDPYDTISEVNETNNMAFTMINILDNNAPIFSNVSIYAVSEDNFIFSTDVFDREGDDVHVTLEVFTSGSWHDAGTKYAYNTTSLQTLTWSYVFNWSETDKYRFNYTDEVNVGSYHSGVINAGYYPSESGELIPSAIVTVHKTFTGSVTKTGSKYLDTIPIDVYNVTITLESSNDLDLSLYNSSAGMIVGWKGIISQYDGGVFHYNGMEINYSGFYSGSEYIKIDKTTEALDLKVYGFYAGDYLVNLTYTTIPIAPPPVINDTTPPIISKVQSKVLSGTSAIITWDTDELSNSIVKYGTTTSLGSTQINASYVRSHSVTLTGLTSDTQYYFEVQSTDASGNTAIENNNGSYYTFTIPSFKGSLNQNELKYLQTIPSGANNVNITLEASSDIDLNLFDSTGNLIVGWKGIISQYDGGIFHYNGMTINYSGFYGGSEYIKIDRTTEALDLKVFGLSAGDYAVNVEYS